MQTFLLSFGMMKEANPDGQIDDGSARRLAAFLSAFELGPAWHGGQDVLFIRTSKTIDEVHSHVVRFLDTVDLLLIVPIPAHSEVRYSGIRWDEEAFDEMFPDAVGTDPHYPP